MSEDELKEVPPPGAEFEVTVSYLNRVMDGVACIDNRTINLGPMVESAEGETIRAKMIDDTFAKCLDLEYRRTPAKYPPSVDPMYVPSPGGHFSDIIDKVSNSGKGSIQVGRHRINIGPVKDEFVGEEVTVMMVDHQRGVCISEEARDDGYEDWLADVRDADQSVLAELKDEDEEMAPESDSRITQRKLEGQETEASDQDTESVPSNSPELKELRKKAEEAADEDPVRDTSMTVGSRYSRAPAIKVYAKARAAGDCEYCGEPAPFETPDGEPYLEVHHVDELGEGGSDHPDKVIAVCPTCHKEIHHSNHGEKMNQDIRKMLEDSLSDVGIDH
ncbi:HNH endonuclease [Saliphagus sp. GCM10025308]